MPDSTEIAATLFPHGRGKQHRSPGFHPRPDERLADRDECGETARVVAAAWRPSVASSERSMYARAVRTRSFWRTASITMAKYDLWRGFCNGTLCVSLTSERGDATLRAWRNGSSSTTGTARADLTVRSIGAVPGLISTTRRCATGCSRRR